MEKVSETKQARMDQVPININKEDTKLRLDRIEDRVDETKEPLETMKADIVPMKEDLNEIKTKVSSELPKSDEPKIFTVKEPVKTFTGRESELIQLHDKLQTQQKQVVVSQCASISGLGGMGKSELARKYAHTYHESYGSCIWIDSETQSSITESFRELAEELQTPIRQKSFDGERNTLLIVRDIYKCFSRSKSLFIFDNVNQFEDIEDYLPSNLSPTDEKPTVIITSRNRDWDIGDEGDVGLILLYQFTPAEALNFVKKVLEIKDEDMSHDTIICELTKELCCFPLALRQATSYIKAKKCLDPYIKAIENYLVEIRDENKKRDLLQYKTRRDRFTETTYTTWQITSRNIKENEANGPLAIRLVEIMAYLEADDIPLKGFMKLAENDENLNEVKDILVKYSIITLNVKCRRFSYYAGNSANIHRLIQQVIRLWLQDGKRDEDVLRAALTQIHDYVPEPHRAALWGFACNYTALINYYLSKIHEESKLYYNFIDALGYLVKDGNTRTIEKILNNLEGMNDPWREISSHILNMRFIACNHNDDSMENTGHATHIKASVLFHSEVYNALKHSNTKDLELFVQSLDKSLKNSLFRGFTALQRSAESGKLHVVKILVENGADVNSPNQFYGNALHIALSKNHPKIADYLLDHGADLNATNEKGWEVLGCASCYGHLNIVKRLVDTIGIYENGTEVDWEPLYLAAQNNQVEIVEFFIKHEVYRSAMKDHGQTLCSISALPGSIQVVKYLIENKLANVNGRDCNNNTLLTIAAINDQFDIVKYLLSEETPDKVGTDAHNIFGITPLLQAVLRGNVQIARFLIEHGAAVENVQNGNTLLGKLNISALHLAVAYNHIDIVKFLVEECNRDINMGLNTTFSPLQVAKYFDSQEVCEFLIRNGADTSEWNEDNLENITGIFRSFCEENKKTDMVDKVYREFSNLKITNRMYHNYSKDAEKRFEILNSYLKKLKLNVRSGQVEE